MTLRPATGPSVPPVFSGDATITAVIPPQTPSS
jgi:hypothetical protein